MGACMRFAIACVRTWTWFYTQGLSCDERSARRHEIQSDLWEFKCDMAGNDGFGSALHILLRMLIGIPDDIAWRVEQEAVAGTLKQRSMALSGRVAGAALFISALWVIDADASRRRTMPAVEGRI